MAPDFSITSMNPFNRDEYYHDNCDITDENNQQQRENCRLFGLPDLKQEHQFVREKYLEWIKDIIEEYDFDGVRYADVPYVPKWFWKEFSAAAGTYTFGVVSSSNPTYIADYQRYMDGVGNYPLFYAIKESFCGGSMSKLEWYLFNQHTAYLNPKYNVNWADNHDNPRFLNWCNDKRLFRNALIFYFFYEGIPTFYYGDEQYFNGGSDPNNRENMFGYHYTDTDIYKMMKIANEVRSKYKVYDEDLVQRYADDYFYAYTRGNVLIAISNAMNLQRNINYHSFDEGDKLCNKLKEGDCVYVIGGNINIIMDGEPKIYVKE
jgi:alpha-amylase